jgi:RNA polymerase sigma factor (TIGR02999 family)
MMVGEGSESNRRAPAAEAVTRLLSDLQSPSPSRTNELLELVYGQLRATAQKMMSSERQDHTLSATALVHEAYARLVGGHDVDWKSRAHFYAAAAEAMRRILIEHARSRNRVKRGGDGKNEGPRKASLDYASVVDLAANESPEQILALDEVFQRLEQDDPEAAAVVRLRFFAGLSVDDAARALDLSPRQVDRLWAFARARLFRMLSPTP